MQRFLYWVDLPPVWLLAFAFLGWVQERRLPWGPPGGPVGDLLAGLLIGGGVILALLALSEMARQRTTPIPHRDARNLVVTGIFRRSRNPIYLGDLMILTGLFLLWGAWPSLILVPVLGWVLTDRFIRPEEARLADRFGRAYEDYTRRTRRWL